MRLYTNIPTIKSPVHPITRTLSALLIAVSSLATAAPTTCPSHFVGGVAPDVLIPALNNRLYARCFDAYASAASGITKGGLWSAEHLTRENVQAAHHVPRVDDFHTDLSIPPADRAELSDYAGSRRIFLDRGHLSPSGDAFSPEAQDQSFLINGNVVPQNHQNNSNEWEHLESTARLMAERDGDIYIVTGPAFIGTGLRRIGSGVIVPSHLFKAVYSRSRGAGVYVTLNAPGYGYALLSVADFERFAGVDPFPALPPGVKAHVGNLYRPRLDGAYQEPHALSELAAIDAGTPEETAGTDDVSHSHYPYSAGRFTRSLMHGW
ncbi:hypothetical protein R70006_06209 [Paraburkholderia domus]|uniref:DNA/RNA non-specific endonuclease n=1 Tax=Paraburkholderia domus TaxID=2793075 RepID=UPI0019131D86|nr:DNA/RNA non-specific endonuclease [Paraburkholderia domus]MBK5052841.1 DNA/RNA non-specific endonuclease [Burkholderia sp. R-70006]CAE6821266.1 hypothetical protein R70006_06209 [Paraburkholderia domus]